MGPHAILHALRRMRGDVPWEVGPACEPEGVAAAVEEAIRHGYAPLLLGGDPPLGLRALEGLRRVRAKAALWAPPAPAYGREVHLSVDLGVLDCGVMPAVAAPRPDGISWKSLMRLLAQGARRRRILSADVSGLCPVEGLFAPDAVAARVVEEVARRMR